MVIRYVSQVRFSCNIFIIKNDKNEAILIDPGASTRRLMDDLKTVNLKAILLTHGHFDHIESVDKIKSIYDVDLYCFEEEDFLRNMKKNCSYYTDEGVIINSHFSSFDNEITIGDFKILVYHTPGHTAGSVIYYFENEKAIFFGDTILEFSIGRTDLYSASNQDMKRSLLYIKTLPFKDDDICYFGHGEQMDFATLKKYNQYL